MKNGTLEVTTVIGCNILCRACPQKLLLSSYFKKDKSRVSNMSMETFKQCIDQVPQDVRIDFSGMAEPWLNSHCSEMLAYAAEKGHPIAVYTTLFGMTLDDIDIIFKYHYTDFVLHLPDNEGNTKIPITEEYMKVIKKLLSSKKIIGRNIVTGVSCHGELHEELKFLENKENLYYIRDLHDRAGNVEAEDLKLHKCNIRGHFRCIESGIDLNHNVLLPDGTVVLCCMDYGMKHVLGNLLFDSYDTILSGSEHKKIVCAMDLENEDILCRKCYNARNIDGIYAEFKALRGRYQKLIEKNGV